MTAQEEHASGQKEVAGGQRPVASSGVYAFAALRQKVGGSQETGRRPYFSRRHLEVEVVLTRLRFLDPGQIDARVRFIGRLEIEESVHGLPNGNQTSVKSAALDLRSIQRALLVFLRQRERQGRGNFPIAFPAAIEQHHVAGGQGLQAAAFSSDKLRFEVELQSLAGIVLQAPPAPAELRTCTDSPCRTRSGLLFADVRNRGDGDLILRLVARIRRCGTGRETRFLVRRSGRRYTQKNDQRHSSHLFPLPDPPTRPQSGGGPVSTLPGNPRPQVFRRLAPSGWASFPPTIQTTGSGAIWFHAVSVGEVLSAVESSAALRAEPSPNAPCIVSTTTLAGRATAEQKLEGLARRRLLRAARLPVHRPARAAAAPSGRGGDARNRNLAQSVSRIEARRSVFADAGERPHLRPRRCRATAAGRVLPPCARLADAIFAQSEEDARRFVAAGAPARIRCELPAI